MADHQFVFDRTVLNQIVIIEDTSTGGDAVARVEHCLPDPSFSGGIAYELSARDVDGANVHFTVDSRGYDSDGQCRVMRIADHPVDQLFAEIGEFVEPYAARTEPVWVRLPGTAFFPGGSGLWRPRRESRLPPMPEGGVMVLGQDYYTRIGYLGFLDAGDEVNTPTWRTIRGLFSRVGLSEDRCFFTNAWMGLRSDGKATGPYAGVRDRSFTERCASFLNRQIAVQKPQLILVLGNQALRMIRRLAPSLEHRWGRGATITSVDADNAGLVQRVLFPDAGPVTASVAVLVHPCMRNSNVHRRRFSLRGKCFVGDEAEVVLLEEALNAPT